MRALPKAAWIGSPKIGWWAGKSPVTLYHGTAAKNVHSIAQFGIRAPVQGPTAGWVSLAIEPNTAHGYASMTGGESKFRAAGGRPRTVPESERAVLVVRCRLDWLLSVMDPDLGGNAWLRNRMADRSTYEAWSGTDQEYYGLLEVRVPAVAPEMVVAYMAKKAGSAADQIAGSAAATGRL